MHHLQTQSLPTTRGLLKATAMAICIAAVLLVTIVLPAEYRIDPTGVGHHLGLDTLGQAADADVPPILLAAEMKDANAALAAKAEAAFGKNAGQVLDASAVSLTDSALRHDTLKVTLAPGKGAEIKARLKIGEGLTFRWQATDDVAVDMHGEQADTTGTWTSYAVEAAQREAAGTFIAPFEGSHGWYWQNRGTKPVTVKIEVSGFQPRLHQP